MKANTYDFSSYVLVTSIHKNINLKKIKKFLTFYKKIKNYCVYMSERVLMFTRTQKKRGAT